MSGQVEAPVGKSPGRVLPRDRALHEGDSSMAKYTFALGSDADVRQAGVIQSDSFDEALRALGEKISVKKGDTLEIGVSGFPPARFECIAALFDGDVLWRPFNQRAA
jgi:hypothetical protein